jgi:membrane-bound lytic murein transglycosylase D
LPNLFDTGFRVIFRPLIVAFGLLLAGCAYLPLGTDETSSAESSRKDIDAALAINETDQDVYAQHLFPQPSNPDSERLLIPIKDLTLVERAVTNFSWADYSSQEDVDYWINRYSKDSEQFEAILDRAEPYLFHILMHLEQANLPAELAFLPFVESGFRPDVASWSGAAGLWQFMPATGRSLGLNQDWWIDERRSVDSSTEAAITYLNYLYNYFDQDWFMALAAYNTGEGNLRKAMRASAAGNANSETLGFWDLNLNSETASYVPKLLAVVHILETADDRSLQLPEWPNQAYFETYESERQLDLEALATHLEIDKEKIFAINAHYPQAITAPNEHARILLPVGMSQELDQIIESLPEVTGPSWAHYRVRSGDNLSLIADRMGVRVRDVIAANQLKSNLIHPGDDLLIPSPASKIQPDPSIPGAVAMVRPGDSIWLIARRYGIGINALLAANELGSSDFIYPGQTLKLPVEQEGDSRITHEVRNGDSLYDIAEFYGVRLTELKRWNSLGSSNLIRPGDRLTIWQAID